MIAGVRKWTTAFFVAVAIACLAFASLPSATGAPVKNGTEGNPSARSGERANPNVGTVTGLPLPRFVSLKADRAHVRRGPGTNYAIKWTYLRRGLPLEILEEYGNWRQIRDWSGESGWIHEALLSSRRTALVSPWNLKAVVQLRAAPKPGAPITARLQPKLLVRISSCAGGWCHITVKDVDGYVRQDRLWGVYPNETIRHHSLF